METNLVCQSCGMPFTAEVQKGIEKDGSKSSIYCSYCYQNGAFTRPGLTFADMEAIVRNQMAQIGESEESIRRALNVLPHLKRWKGDPHLL